MKKVHPPKENPSYAYGCKSSFRCFSVSVVLFLLSLHYVCAWQIKSVKQAIKK